MMFWNSPWYWWSQEKKKKELSGRVEIKPKNQAIFLVRASQKKDKPISISMKQNRGSLRSKLSL